MDAETTAEEQAGEQAREEFGGAAGERTGSEAAGIPIPDADAKAIGWDRPVGDEGIEIGGYRFTGEQLTALLHDTASLVDEVGGPEAFYASIAMMEEMELYMSNLLSDFDDQARKLAELPAGEISRAKFKAIIEEQAEKLRNYHRRLHPISTCVASFRATTASRWTLTESRCQFIKAAIPMLTNNWSRMDLLVRCVTRANEFCREAGKTLGINPQWKSVRRETVGNDAGAGASGDQGQPQR